MEYDEYTIKFHPCKIQMRFEFYNVILIYIIVFLRMF